MKFSASVVLGLAASLSSVSAFAPRSSNAGFAKSTTFVVSDPIAATEVTPNGAASAETFFSPPEETMTPMVVENVNLDRIEPGRYDGEENSVALPFLKRPPLLDGSHAGDFGFDPLGFTENYDLYTMQEAELRHARLAMLAVVGWPLSELIAPDWMLQNGCAPSVLNGFNPISALATVVFFAGFGFFEYTTALRNTASTPSGKKHLEDMEAVWKNGVAGDYGFDPLGLYSSIGDSAVARKGLREVEISHGRMAMLGITAFAAWEKLTGAPIVENSMFFHPNLLLPALFAGYVAFNQVYEVDNDGQYILQVKMSDEGRARVENLKMSVRATGNAVQTNPVAKVVAGVGEKAAGITDKVMKFAEGAGDNLPNF